MDIFYTIVEFFVAGGAFMVPILIVGAAATAIAVERYVTLTRSIAANRNAWNSVEAPLTAGDFDKAREVTAKDSTPMSRLLAVGLARQGARRRCGRACWRSFRTSRSGRIIWPPLRTWPHCSACSARSAA
jgi:biopolymer transport protein ExbB